MIVHRVGACIHVRLPDSKYELAIVGDHVKAYTREEVSVAGCPAWTLREIKLDSDAAALLVALGTAIADNADVVDKRIETMLAKTRNQGV